MKTIHIIPIASLFILFSGAANADCAVNQPVEAIIDCIVEEGSGGSESLSTELSRPFVADEDGQQAESKQTEEEKNPG